MLEVCEIFESIQGEGTFIGTPCIFIRLSGCNLSCTWCDTRYALLEKGTMMTETEIVKKVKKQSENKFIVLTGGEPLLQNLDKLVMMLANEDFIILIETNGTIVPTIALEQLVDHWIVSPKLGSSGMKDRLNPKAIVRFKNCHSEWKFVIFNFEDFLEYLEFMRKFNITQDVVMQPVNNNEQIGRNIVAFVLDHKMHDIRVLPQMHKWLWEGERGR